MGKNQDDWSLDDWDTIGMDGQPIKQEILDKISAGAHAALPKDPTMDEEDIKIAQQIVNAAFVKNKAKKETDKAKFMAQEGEHDGPSANSELPPQIDLDRSALERVGRVVGKVIGLVFSECIGRGLGGMVALSLSATVVAAANMTFGPVAALGAGAAGLYVSARASSALANKIDSTVSKGVIEACGNIGKAIDQGAKAVVNLAKGKGGARSI